MRNMSFALTTRQVIDGTKTVTRRLGWWDSRPGERVQGCEKCQGLKKGEKIRRLRIIEIVSLTPEILCCITRADVIREGFPNMTCQEFIEMFCRFNQCNPQKVVNRIAFKYV